MTPLELISDSYGLTAVGVEAESMADGSRWYWAHFAEIAETEPYRSTEFRDAVTANRIVTDTRARAGLPPLTTRLTDRDCRRLVRAFNEYLED